MTPSRCRRASSTSTANAGIAGRCLRGHLSVYLFAGNFFGQTVAKHRAYHAAGFILQAHCAAHLLYRYPQSRRSDEPYDQRRGKHLQYHRPIHWILAFRRLDGDGVVLYYALLFAFDDAGERINHHFDIAVQLLYVQIYASIFYKTADPARRAQRSCGGNDYRI